MEEKTNIQEIDGGIVVTGEVDLEVLKLIKRHGHLRVIDVSHATFGTDKEEWRQCLGYSHSGPVYGASGWRQVDVLKRFMETINADKVIVPADVARRHINAARRNDAINEVVVPDDCRLFAMMDGCVYNKNLTKMVFEARSADHIYHHKLDELWGGMIVAGENMTSLYSDDCECGMDASGFLFAYDKYKEAQKLVIDTFGDEARIDQESDEAMDAACAVFRAQEHIPADMIEQVRGFVKQMVRFFNRSARRHVS